jgi:hypothetical protein
MCGFCRAARAAICRVNPLEGTGAPVEGGGTAAPEINSASMVSALTLLCGALLVLRGRKARGQA